MGVSITEKLVLVLLVAIPITNTNHEIPHQGECKGRSQASATNIDVVFRFLRSILAVSAYSIAIRVSDFDFALVMEFLGGDESDIGCFRGGAVHCGCLAQKRRHHPCFNTSGLDEGEFLLIGMLVDSTDEAMCDVHSDGRRKECWFL
jgi:hypothetical protein